MCNEPLRVASLGLICALVCFECPLAQPFFAEPSVSEPESPLHAQVIEYLRNSDSPVPNPFPELNPIHTISNAEAIVPPQCYTMTAGTHNPCYVCHQNQVPERENSMNDGDLQVAYSFSDVGMTNHWANLFEDRSAAVAAISDVEILEWIAQDNYSELAGRLESAQFGGWIPDLENLQLGADAFDEEGFARDGSQWVAFNYKPLPSTFWPTNGSTDDVMIRLPGAFRTNEDGEYSRDVYMANLAIVEANIKGQRAVTTWPINERRVGVDLDGDGRLRMAESVTAVDAFVGLAAREFLDSYLYPEGTEFLHTVRYLGINDDGTIGVSTRIKEVRYMRKVVAYRKSVYARGYQLEAYSKELGNLPRYISLDDAGLDNGFGWVLQGFIEDAEGRLRSLTFEENLACMGCHTSIGSSIDKTLSFPRKVDGRAGWTYINLHGMPDAPNVGETRGEIATYLERAGGGGEFRSNPEMYERWFDASGAADQARIGAAEDVYELIAPSVERALELNKAYRVIVSDQDYIYGRDATTRPPENVYRQVDNATAPVLPAGRFFQWDIRLDWPTGAQRSQ